jgi:hypothetical protein
MTSPAQAEIIELGIGDTVPIGNILLNMFLMGLVTDPNNPNMFAATMQAYQRQGLLTVPVLQGVKGDPGEPSFALHWVNDAKTDPSQLPTDLGNSVADLGKFWIFGVQDELGNTVATTMYVWWGTTIGWRQLPVGAPGPPGAYPVITPHIVLEAQGSGNGPGGVDSWIHVDGSVAQPQFIFHIAAPEGLTGPSAALGSCPDVDFQTRAPQAGDILVCTARKTPGAPTALGVVGHTTGGTIPAGTYFYKVIATMPNAKTLPGNEVSVVNTGSTSSNTLTWTAPANQGATGYEIYRGTAIGAENKLVGIVNSGETTTFLDTNTGVVNASLPTEGVVAGRPIWVAQPQVDKFPYIYTLPEGSFTSAGGIGGSVFTIGNFPVPAVPWKWKPYIIGQVSCFGLNISFSPLLIGVEVRLGDPLTGQIVARGFGNSLGYVTFIPHTSSPENPTTAMTPTNGVGLVQANHTGTQGTLYFNLINQGMAGLFDFDAANAGVSIIQAPVPQ